MCFFYLFPCADVKHDFYITWSSYLLTIIRRVSLVEPELLTLPENLCRHPCFSGVRVCSIFSFLHSVFYIVVCPFVLSSLTIVLTAIRFTPSDIWCFQTFLTYILVQFHLDFEKQNKKIVWQNNWPLTVTHSLT